MSENKRNFMLPASIVVAALIIGFAWIYAIKLKATSQQKNPAAMNNKQEDAGTMTELPVQWGDLGIRMIETGVIDQNQFEAIYNRRGGLTAREKELLAGRANGALKINQENAGLILNLLWGVGLSAKNQILENGHMADPSHGGPNRFASIGGWTIAKGNAMNHYGAHSFITLTDEQQQLIERVSKNIYRPCCDNAAYFPDCNHGMAMLGLLELLASQGASEKEMYSTALIINSYWFPDQYAAIARYLGSKGLTVAKADPKEILGEGYSSASGFRQVAILAPQTQNSGSGGQNGCGLSNLLPQNTNQKSQGGCGL